MLDIQVLSRYARYNNLPIVKLSVVRTIKIGFAAKSWQDVIQQSQCRLIAVPILLLMNGMLI